MAPSEPKRLLRWLGERSWLGVVRVGVAALGVGLTGWLLTSVWPEPDRVADLDATRSTNKTTKTIKTTTKTTQTTTTTTKITTSFETTTP